MSTSVVINQEFLLLDNDDLDRMDLIEVLYESDKASRYIDELNPYNVILHHYYSYLQEYITNRLNKNYDEIVIDEDEVSN